TNAEKLEALSKLTDLHIAEERSESKAGPLRETIDDQAKELRAIKAELGAANTQATEAQTRAESIEAERKTLVNERDGLKSDIVRLGNTIRTLACEKQQALSAQAETSKQLE